LVLVLVVGLLFCFFWMPFTRYSLARDPCKVAAIEFVPKANPALPKIIHQQWATYPIDMEPQSSWRRKVLATFPEHRHILWTDEKARDLIRTKFPWFLAQYDAYDENIKRVDAVRPFILYEYGGLYFDLDYEPLQNFWERLPDDIPCVLQSVYWTNEKVQNAVLSSPPRHEFWNLTFETLMEPGRKDKHVLTATGPHVIEDSMRKYNGKVGVLPCENWHRLPKHEFHPLRKNILATSLFVLPCGDIDNMECHYGIHHGTTVYAPE